MELLLFVVMAVLVLHRLYQAQSQLMLVVAVVGTHLLEVHLLVE